MWEARRCMSQARLLRKGAVRRLTVAFRGSMHTARARGLPPLAAGRHVDETFEPLVGLERADAPGRTSKKTRPPCPCNRSTARQ